MSKPCNRVVTEGAIRPAASIAAGVALLSFLALLAVLSSGLHWGIRLPLSMVLVVYAVVWLSFLLRPRWQAVSLEQDEVILTDHDGGRHRMVLQGRPFVSPLYIGFCGRLDNARRRCRVGVFRGQLATEDFRRLAAGLRIKDAS